jgi:hypothetical protein
VSYLILENLHACLEYGEGRVYIQDMFKNTINAAAIMYAREIDPKARLVDEDFPLTRMPIKPRAEIATAPVHGPVCSYVEVPVVLPSKANKVRGLGGLRVVKVNPDNLVCFGVVV